MADAPTLTRKASRYQSMTRPRGSGPAVMRALISPFSATWYTPS